MSMFELAYQAIHRGDFHQAVDLFSRSMEEESLSPRQRFQALNARADALFQMGHHDQAMKDYNRLIEMSPRSPFSLLPRSLAYLKKGQYQLAIEDFNRMVELDPEYLYAYLYRSEAFYHTGEYARAVEDYDQLVAWSPEDVYVFFHRGLAQYYLGHFESAEGDFETCLDLDGQDAYAMIWLYLSREHDGRTGELQLVAQSRNLNPRHWPQPVISFLLDNGTEAEVLESIADPDPSLEAERTCEAYFYIGQYHLLREDNFRAMEKFHRCVDLAGKRFITAAAQQELHRLSGD